MHLKLEEFLNLQTHLKPISKDNYRRILLKIGKELPIQDDFSKNNVITYLNCENFLSLEIASQNRYKTVLKKYLDFLGMNTDFIQKKKEIKRELNKEQLLGPEEIQNILDKMTRNRDKCLFMLLLEGKIRIGEATQLHVGDFVDKGTHYNMYIRESKSAQRSIPLVSSVPYIIQYLNNHPFKLDPHAPFFARKYRGKVQGYSISGLRQIIVRNSKHIPKHVYPHLLRHTGLTQSAKFLSDSLLMQIAGWRTRSMVDRYVHLASDDLEKKVLELHGLQPIEKKEGMAMISNATCPRCNFSNPGSNKFCSRCGSALDIKTVLKAREVVELGEKKLSREELFELFMEWLKEK